MKFFIYVLCRYVHTVDMSLSKLWETVKDREAWHAAVSMGSQRVRHGLATKHTHTHTDLIDPSGLIIWYDIVCHLCLHAEIKPVIPETIIKLFIF